jgi:trigger factor
MRKKLLAAVLCVCTVLSVTGCKGKNSDTDTSNTAGSIKLGQYTGYIVGESVTQVDDESVQKYINSILDMYSTTQDVTEGVTAENDTVSVTYHQTVNGEEVGDYQVADDGTSEGITEKVTLAENAFVVDGFTDALIGHAVGETVEMDLQFPEDYSDETLAGQPVHYSAVINSISQTVVPEFNDEFVQQHYEFAGFTTAADFTDFIRKEIYYINVNSQIWDDVLDAQTVESYPADELQDYVDRTFAQVEATMEAYGYTMDIYYQMQDTTEEDFMKDLESNCKPIVKEKMFVRAVAEKEGITYSEEAAAKYAAISGYTSVDEFKEYLESYGEDLEYSVLSYLVQNFVCDSTTVVSDEETTADETTADTAEEVTTEAAEETSEEAAETPVEETQENAEETAADEQAE